MCCLSRSSSSFWRQISMWKIFYWSYNWKALILFGTVVLVVRPLGVFVSSIGQRFKINEKLFISWVGPRGIVAAGIASLFGLELVQAGCTRSRIYYSAGIYDRAGFGIAECYYRQIFCAAGRGFY